jgi:hypothetical protein
MAILRHLLGEGPSKGSSQARTVEKEREIKIKGLP